jgi:hypothetical protein
MAIGRKMASAPMFFISDESTATLTVRIATWRPVVVMSGCSRWIKRAITFDLPTLALITMPPRQ